MGGWGYKCVGCLGRKERLGREAEMAAGQRWRAVLPGPIPQKLLGPPVVWSQATIPVKPTSP